MATKKEILSGKPFCIGADPTRYKWERGDHNDNKEESNGLIDRYGLYHCNVVKITSANIIGFTFIMGKQFQFRIPLLNCNML